MYVVHNITLAAIPICMARAHTATRMNWTSLQQAEGRAEPHTYSEYVRELYPNMYCTVLQLHTTVYSTIGCLFMVNSYLQGLRITDLALYIELNSRIFPYSRASMKYTMRARSLNFFP